MTSNPGITALVDAIKELRERWDAVQVTVTKEAGDGQLLTIAVTGAYGQLVTIADERGNVVCVPQEPH